MFKFAVFVFVAVYFITSTYGYSDCGSKVGSIVSVAVTGCTDDSKRCILKRKTNVTMEINFVTNVDSSSLKAVVHGVILDFPTPFPLPNPDGCHDSGITCPIQAGQQYKYTTIMPVSQSYPRITVDVKWELQDANGEDIVCVLIPSKIQ